MHLLTLILLCAISILPSLVLAATASLDAATQSASLDAATKDAPPLTCSITPSMRTIEPEPDNFVTNNNLRRKVGAPIVAKGEPLLIKGRLLDERCVPIANAIIEIWQVDADGNIVYDTPRRKGDMHSEFAGSGTASTDNLGRFTFLTIKPSATKKEAAHLNVMVTHDAFSELNTVAYFDNGTTKKHATLTKLTGEDPSYGTPYELIITLKGKEQYRTY